MAHDVFISYSSMDKAVADAVCVAVETDGLQCWIAPRDVLPGKDYGAAIIEGINNTSVMVLILSTHSNQSAQVIREVERAVAKGVPIIPFRTEDFPLSDSMEYFISSQHWLDATSEPVEQHYSKLCQTIRMLLSKGRKTEEVPLGRTDRAPVASVVPPPETIAPQAFDLESIALDPEQLSEEEFGGGSKLTTTGFLVFGLLTFWVYTIVGFHRILASHFQHRREYFEKCLKESEAASAHRAEIDKIGGEALRISSGIKNLCLFLNTLCAGLIGLELVAQILFAEGYVAQRVFDQFTISATVVASLSFCASIITFLTWVGRRLKAHEYNESLLAWLAYQPDRFKIVRPSEFFTKRWNKFYNYIALFLVVAIPMTISPAVAVYHVYQLINEGGAWQTAIVIWMLVIFAFVAVFHVGGTYILMNMYNQHLEFELTNRRSLEKMRQGHSQ